MKKSTVDVKHIRISAANKHHWKKILRAHDNDTSLYVTIITVVIVVALIGIYYVL